MKRMLQFWTILIVSVLIVLFATCSCKPKGPTRLSKGIAGCDDGVSTGWFCYVMETGDIIEQEGVMMNFSATGSGYAKSNGMGGIEVIPVGGIQSIESTGITGPNGMVVVKGNRTNWGEHTGVWICTGATLSGDTGGSATFDYRTLAVTSRQWAAADAPQRIKRESFVAALLTPKEVAAMNAPTSNPPDAGIEVVSNDILTMQGSLGQGAPREMSSFMAVNLDTEEKYLRYASPFMFSCIFKTPDPINLAGRTFPAIVKTDFCPSGIKVSIQVIQDNVDNMTHVARTEYFLPVKSTLDMAQNESVPVYDRWTAFENPNIWDAGQYDIQVREDWLDTIDPNVVAAYDDPNDLFDRNNPDFFKFTSRLDPSAKNFYEIMIPDRVLTIKIIPIEAEGDYLYLVIDKSDPSFIISVSDHWLSNYPVLDMNNDSIVNLKDWSEFK